MSRIQFINPSYREKLLAWLKGIVVALVFAYFFYRSPYAVLFLLPLSFFYQKAAINQLLTSKQDEMRRQFKELIEIVAGNLRAGYSVENAFLEAGKDMSRMYHAELPVINMLAFIRKGLENNVPFDVRLKEAGQISGVYEIVEFAEVFAVAKHSGGNMIDTISQFSNMIGDKIETEKEIRVLVSARRGEQKIMNIVPFAILFYLDLTSPGFFASLYHNLAGIMVMTVCMALYLIAYAISVRMLKMEV
jgi:tight adherence protein B